MSQYPASHQHRLGFDTLWWLHDIPCGLLKPMLANFDLHHDVTSPTPTNSYCH